MLSSILNYQVGEYRTKIKLTRFFMYVSCLCFKYQTAHTLQVWTKQNKSLSRQYLVEETSNHIVLLAFFAQFRHKDNLSVHTQTLSRSGDCSFFHLDLYSECSFIGKEKKSLGWHVRCWAFLTERTVPCVNLVDPPPTLRKPSLWKTNVFDQDIQLVSKRLSIHFFPLYETRSLEEVYGRLYIAAGLCIMIVSSIDRLTTLAPFIFLPWLESWI